MPALLVQAASKIQIERAMGASLPAFADIPDMSVAVTSTASWAMLFSGVFLVPKPGTIEIRFTADNVPVANSERVMDVSAGGLMNDRCLTLEALQSVGIGLDVRVQWRAVKGKVTLTDRRLMIFH